MSQIAELVLGWIFCAFIVFHVALRAFNYFRNRQWKSDLTFTVLAMLVAPLTIMVAFAFTIAIPLGRRR
ncbi:hypothetical protein [Novosphingobium naphthalenivorans]|uniref:hypothetical protein n=1 Tax=Novosphingobium naphthalenivorans TaxID=273168 RepID=UPI0008344EF8|nr:hypothetical protein [Novosphingobium naphthalenivorans]